MSDADLHHLYGPAKRRIFYKKSDFADYMLMLIICSAVLAVAFQTAPYLLAPGQLLCAFMAFSFPLRHGAAMQVPLIVRRPLDVLYMLVYKVRNIKPMLVVAIAVLAFDNLFIAATPDWPHHTELMRKAAVSLFYAHFVLVSLYRTVILLAHLRHRERVRDVLMQTSWKGALDSQPNVTLHIVHAYATGLLTHLVLLAPWYVVVTHVQYSLVTLFFVSIANVAGHLQHMHIYSRWFYRDHWLAHNCEFDFVYLHGTHHDAIPCGLIGVSGNGFLEGVLRDTTGNPMAFYSPLIAFLLHTAEVIQDMRMHQYIPGVYPILPRQVHEVSQHSTHHFGRLEPYSIGLRMVSPADPPRKKKWRGFPPEEILNSIALDEKLNGFEWDNPRYRHFLEIYDRYQNQEKGSDAGQPRKVSNINESLLDK